jgi:hypothetical protein
MTKGELVKLLSAMPDSARVYLSCHRSLDVTLDLKQINYEANYNMIVMRDYTITRRREIVSLCGEDYERVYK